jgi:hypothetical protein
MAMNEKNQNNQTQNNYERRQLQLLDKNVEIDPVGVVYNVTGTAIEDFVYNYLTDVKKIDGVSAIRVHVNRDGNQRPEISLYVFISMNSEDVASNLSKIPDLIKAKMDESVYRPSKKLESALWSLTREPKIGVHSQERLLYVKCNVFKALGIMFGVDPRVHELRILEVIKAKKKNSIITVLKKDKFIDRDDAASFDKYQDMIDNIED